MPIQRPLSHQDITIMESLYDSDQHHLAYSYYYSITGVEQADFQSKIANPATTYGRIAMEANRLAQQHIHDDMGAGAYPQGGLHNFSREISRDFLDRVRRDVESGGTGILSDQQIEDAAYGVWQRHGIGDYFPGNFLEGRLDTPGAWSAFEAYMVETFGLRDIEGPGQTPIDNDNFYTPPLNFRGNSAVEGEWDWRRLPGGGRGGQINPSRLIEQIFGRSRNSGRQSGRQIAIASASSIAQALLSSRRQSLQGAVMDMLGFDGSMSLARPYSRRPRMQTPPYVPDYNAPNPFASVIGNLFENALGAVFNRGRTRTSTTESARSVQAQANWNLSQGQQAALLAQMVQQGSRNL